MSTKWHKLKLPAKCSQGLVWGASIGFGGLLYLKVWLPATGIGVSCILHELTGLYCPGCGITRAALSLLNFDFYQAFRYNPLVFIILPMYLMYIRANNSPFKRGGKLIMAAMLTATVAFGILRNIPAFDWLAPTTVQ